MRSQASISSRRRRRRRLRLASRSPPSAREAVAQAEIVVTMLPAGKHVLASHADFLPAAPKGALVIDSSTIDVDSAKRAHEAGARRRRADPRRAGLAAGSAAQPPARSPSCAAVRTRLSPRAKPILENMGKRIVHCGGAGAGQAAKICNNMILGATMIVTCEAFALAEKLGLSAQALFDVASTSSGQSWSLSSYCPVPGPVPASPANRDYKPGFAASLMLKDLKLAQEAAASAGAATPLGAEAAQLYALYVAAGHGGDDFSGVINFLRGVGVFYLEK